MKRPRASGDAPFWTAAAWLTGAGGGWRVDQLRVERRRTFRVEGRSWTTSLLLACVERPSRGGAPPPLLATAHVHLWGPRGAEALPEPLRREAARFAARGWGVGWDPGNGRFGWIARPLLGGLAPLLEERVALESAFGGPGEAAPGGEAPGAASMAAAIERLRGVGWRPSALGAGRTGLRLPGAGASLDLSLLVLGATGERRARGGRPRAKAAVTIWLPEAARDDLARARRQGDLALLTARLRAAGFRGRWHVAQAGPPFGRFERAIPARLASLRAARSLLDRAAAAVAERPDGDRFGL